MIEGRAGSTFVSVTGILAVIISVVGFLISVAQLIMTRSYAGIAPHVTVVPIAVQLLPLMFVVAAAVSAAFLKRRRWARTGMLLLVAAGFTVHFRWLASDWRNTSGLPTDGSDAFQATLRTIRLLNTFYPAVACALFAFVAIKLMSRAVRREFDSAQSAPDRWTST